MNTKKHARTQVYLTKISMIKMINKHIKSKYSNSLFTGLMSFW